VTKHKTLIKRNLRVMNSRHKIAVTVKIAVSQTSKMKNITSHRSLTKTKIKAIEPTTINKKIKTRNTSRYRISQIQIRYNSKSQPWISRLVQSMLLP